MFTSVIPRMCDSLIFFTFRHVFLRQSARSIKRQSLTRYILTKRILYMDNCICENLVAWLRLKSKARDSISSWNTNWRWSPRTQSSLLVSLAVWEIISVRQSVMTFVTLATSKYGTVMWWHVSVETTETHFVLFCKSIALLSLHDFKFITLVQHKHLICGAVFRLDLY
jgi:hypothetical protein